MKQFYTFFVTLFSIFIYSQVSLVAALETSEFRVNQQFTVTIILQVTGDDYVQQTPLKLPDFSKFEQFGNGTEQNTLITNDQRVNQIIYQCLLAPKKTGEIRIGSAIVTINGKTYKTEPIDIYVQESDLTVVEKNTPKNDLYIKIEVNDKEIFINQPTIAVIKAYSSNINQFRKIKEVNFKGNDVLKITPVSMQRSAIENKSKKVTSQTLAMFIIYPEVSGKTELPTATATISGKNTTLTSNKPTIHVKPLPEGAPENFKNAVGDFKVDVIKDYSENLEVDKPMNLRLKVSGNGNLNNMSLPNILSTENYDVFPPKITSNTKLTENGYEGTVLADYLIVPKKSGSYSIFTDAFTFFDPSTESYKNIETPEIKLAVFSHEAILDNRTTMEKVNQFTNNVLETVDNPIVKTENLKVKQKSGLKLNTVLLNSSILVFSFLFLLFLINSYKNDKNIANNTIKVEDSKNKNSLNLIDDFSQIDLQNSFGYLDRMIREMNFDEFFDGIKELDKKTRNLLQKGINNDFNELLIQEKGLQVEESYRILSQKIQIEKYAPVQNGEQLSYLLQEIISVYQTIHK